MNKITCGSIWGGIRNMDDDVTAGGIRASVHSRAYRSDEGGDIYYFSVCGGDMLSRVAVADVAGHGPTVSDVSSWLYDAMAKRLEDLEGHALLEEINHRSYEFGTRAMATAAVVSYYRETGQLFYAYAGHPPLLIQRAETGLWAPAVIHSDAANRNLPLAVIDDVHYDQACLDVAQGDRVLVMTDGVLEARDASGELFGRERLVETLNAVGDAPTGSVIGESLAAAEKHAGHELDHDDVTLVAFEVM